VDADFNALLLEGCRRLDERRRGAPLQTPPPPVSALPGGPLAAEASLPAD
jgi:hypothetical protein